jgi:hypothetical protein
MNGDFCLNAIRQAKRFHLIEEKARVYKGADAIGAQGKYLACGVENSAAESIYVDASCVSMHEEGWNSKNWKLGCLHVGNDRPDISSQHVGFLAETLIGHTPIISLEVANVIVGTNLFCLDDDDHKIHMRVTQIGLKQHTVVDMVHAPGIEWAVVQMFDSQKKCVPGARVYPE